MDLQQRVEQAYEQDRDDVYRYLVMLGLDPGEAQENTQEAYLRLHTAMSKGEAIRNPRAWVFRVAHRLALRARTRGRNLRPLHPELEALLPGRERTPEAGLLQKEQMMRLTAALGDLSPQQRHCLHLRAEGLRYHEIAETIGIGVSTVGEFLSRAMTKLRKAVR